MMMPGMSGLELIKLLRRQNPDITLLAISGQATNALIHMAFVAGANGYLSKSWSIDELLRRLHATTEGKAEMTGEEADALRWAVRERKLRSEMSNGDLQLLQLFSDEVPVKEIALRTGALHPPSIGRSKGSGSASTQKPTGSCAMSRWGSDCSAPWRRHSDQQRATSAIPNAGLSSCSVSGA